MIKKKDTQVNYSSSKKVQKLPLKICPKVNHVTMVFYMYSLAIYIVFKHHH